jgi:hypothetical protein
MKYAIRRLSRSLGIIIPTKDRRGRDLPSREVAFWQTKVRKEFTEWFGGARSNPEAVVREYRQLGDYDPHTGRINTEPVLLVLSHSTTQSWRRARPRVRRLAQEMLEALDQASLALLEDGRLLLLEKKQSGSDTS